MPITQHITKKKVAAGAALVALSGFVPQPMMQQANAASASISVTGSFITGVQLVAGVSVKFGTFAATAGNGNVTLSTAGAITTTVGAVQVNANSAAGSFSLKVVDTAVPLNVTVAGLGAVTLIASAGGGGPTGTVTLNKVILGGASLGGTFIITDAGGGTGKTVIPATKVTGKTGAMAIGGQLTWGATQPIGQFTQAITLTMAF